MKILISISFFEIILSPNTDFFSLSDGKMGISKFESLDTFSILHLNIRDLSKKLLDFKELYKTFHLNFSIVCF